MEKFIKIIIDKKYNIVFKLKLISNKDINIITKEIFPTPIANETLIKKRKFCLNFKGNKSKAKGSPLNIIANNPKNNLDIVSIYII